MHTLGRADGALRARFTRFFAFVWLISTGCALKRNSRSQWAVVTLRTFVNVWICSVGHGGSTGTVETGRTRNLLRTIKTNFTWSASNTFS